MNKQLLVTNFLLAAALALILAPSIYADTYEYDSLGRLIEVVYDDGSSVSYDYDATGNLLEMATTPADPPSVNEAPDVAILGGNRTISDTDGLAGEIVSFTATATDSDGSIATSEWLIDNVVVATGLTPDITLFDGETLITFRAVDDDGAASTDTVTVTVEPPPLEEGWPVPYSGVTPDESLGLEYNNISAFNPQDGLIYACLRVLSNGQQSDLEGIEAFDIAFQIVSLEEAVIGVVKAKPFNATGALNEYGELPDCSGAIEMTTGIYTDIIQVGSDALGVTFDLFDPVNLFLRATGVELIGSTP